MNLGCVIYSLSNEGLDAEWLFSQSGGIEQGTGKATRISSLNPKRRFEGDFEIIYSDVNKNKSPKLNLTIRFESSGYYKLTWKIDNRITEVGIGVEREDTLLVSYKKTG